MVYAGRPVKKTFALHPECEKNLPIPTAKDILYGRNSLVWKSGGMLNPCGFVCLVQQRSKFKYINWSYLFT